MTNDLKSGHTITASDLVAKRPGTGVSPMSWDEVVGKKVVRDLPEDHILTWDDLAKS